MEFFDEEETFSLEGNSEEAVLPYHEEDWELAAEPQQSLLYLEPDDNNISQSEHLEPYTQQQLASFYHNPILERGDLYTQQFLETSADYNPEFKHLLLSFYQSLQRVTQLQQDNEQWNDNIQRLCQKIFDTAVEQAKAEAYCQDQRKVSTVHHFTSCRFNKNVAHELKIALSDSLGVGVDDMSLALYSMTIARLECEQFIFEMAKLLKHHSENLINNSDSVKSSVLVQLCDESVDCLRQCISTLFCYLRRQDSADNEFYTCSKRWMCQLVTLLYDVTQDGSCQNLLNEEMFVLNHIIRSPPGTQSWAERLIQISTPLAELDFWNSKVVLDHVIYMLFLVLRAPKGRDDFLSNNKSSYSLSSSSRQDSSEINGNWTLIDEDGDELKGVGSKWHVLPLETDLVSLYQQIPFEVILSHVFSLKINKGLYSYTSEEMTSDRFLQVLACCDIMCEVLGEGLATLGTPKYKQLVRRIAQTLRNIVLLMSEHWNKFKESLEDNPQRHSFERLQTEYDEFVKRCVERLLCVARLGVYQFLADLPFHSVSQRAAEVLYVLMNVPAGSRAEVDQLSRTSYTRQEWLDFVEDPDTKLAFEDQLSGMPENEVVYLLTTFCNLAYARPTSESHLVNIIAMDVYKVSFVYTSTRDICSKMGRELLCTVASVHPYIISTVLQYLNKCSDEITSTALYAVSDLPFHQWVPTNQDIALFQEWILEHPVASIPVKLVQTAIKGMKWDNAEDGCLFLPHSLHCEMALLLVKVCCRYEREKQDSGLLLKSIDQVSRVASAMRSSLSFDESFQAWIWDVLLRLKLHRSQLITSDNHEVRDKPNPLRDVNDGSLLPHANKAKIAQSCYVTIMMTNVGHSMNVFLQQGIFLLKTIVESGNKVPAIQCLSCILPMFIKAGVDLSINAAFITVLRDCLASNETGMLFGIASKLFEQRTSVASPVILLCGAISDQISKDETVLVVGYWIKLVLAIPGWWDSDNLKLLLDYLFKTAFHERQQCFNECRAILYERYVEIMMQSSKKNTSSPQHQNRSVISSIIGLVSGSNSAGACFFLKDITSSHTYLTYFILDAETRYEDDSKLWPILLSSMKTSTPEVALKKACSLLKLHHSPIPNQLAIYRWAVFMIATPTDHPLLPVICQNFFLRYIFIMPDIGNSFGPRFFKPSQTQVLLKKLEQKFSDIGNDALLTSDSEFRTRITKLYQTFNVWISEDKLHDDNLYLPSLPSHYEPHLLATVRTRNPNLWLDCVNFGKISEELHHVAVIWQNFHKHEVKAFPSHCSSMSIHATICQRITQLLRQFESPLPLDEIREDITSPIAVGHLSNLTDHRSVSEEIDQDLKSISHFAHVFTDVKSKILVLNQNYMELLPDLYSMEEKSVTLNIECQSSFSSTHRCSGPAHVQLKFQEKTLNEGVSQTLQTNRNSYRDLVRQLCNPSTSAELCYSALHLTNVIKALTKNTTNPMYTTEGILNIFEAGSKMFYTLADMNSDERWKCPTTQHLLTLCLDILGQVFICGRPDQVVPLLEQMLRRPDIAALLSAHFSPAKACHNVSKDKASLSNFNTTVLVDMYENVVNAAINDKSQTFPDVLFVLITKFDLELWCRDCTPPKSDILRLLQAIVLGLETHSTDGLPEEETSVQMTKSFHLSNSAVQEIFITHLCIVVEHSPNIVFFKAINLLLNASANKSLDWMVWEALIAATFKNPESATNEDPEKPLALSEQSLDQCIKYLAVYFSEIRKAKQCGLYGAWSPFIGPLSKLLHCLCVAKINYHLKSERSGMSGPTNTRYHALLVDIILPLFSAWLVPYSSNETNEFLWPWEKSEQSLADHMLNTFSTVVNVICVGADISSCVTTLWRYYVDNVIVAHYNFAPSYICSSYQTALSSVPWCKFIPTLTDLDTMIQLYDLNLSPSLHFLCFVIPEIDWNLIMSMCFQMKKDKENWSEHTPEVLGRLLNLLFKLASDESRVISYDKLKILLRSLDHFPWSVVDYEQLDYVANLVSDGYNAFCLLKKFPVEQKGRVAEDQRFIALRLLQLVSCVPLLDEKDQVFDIQNRMMVSDHFDYDEMIWYKRQSFIRCVGRLIRTTKVTDKSDVKVLEAIVCEHIKRMMKSLYFAITSTDVENLNENCLSLIYSEIWRYLMNFPSVLVESTRKVIFTSLSEHLNGFVCEDPSKFSLFSVVLNSIASSAFSTLIDPTVIATALEHCFEHCIHSFKSVIAPRDGSTESQGVNGNMDSSSLSAWKELCGIFSRTSKVSQQELINECITLGNLLTLTAFSQTMFTATNECDNNTKNNAYQSSLTIIQWLSTCVPTTAIEAKLLLLVGSFLKSCSYLMLVAEMNSDVDVNMHSVNDTLASVVPILEQWCMDKVKTGILGSLGIGKASPLSLGFRTACRCLLLYVKGNLPKARTDNESATDESNLDVETLRKLSVENRVYSSETKRINEVCDLLANELFDNLCNYYDVMTAIISVFFPESKHYLRVL